MKQNPLILWLFLWAISPFILSIRNLISGGYNNGLTTAIILGGMMAIPAVVIGLIIWFIIKAVYKAASGGKELQLTHVFIIWLVLFILAFLFPLFKK